MGEYRRAQDRRIAWRRVRDVLSSVPAAAWTDYKKWFHSNNRDERYDYLYKPEELEPIAASLKTMVKEVEKETNRRQVKKVLAATNNHYRGQPAVNAIASNACSALRTIRYPPS